MWWRAVVVWLGLMAVAILNGAFREAVLVPRLGIAGAHVASTVSLGLLILALTWLTIRWIGPRRRGSALGIGALWLVMTLAFEFGFGHFVAEKSWSVLLADYDLTAGRIWPLALVTVLLAPWGGARARRLF